MRRTGLFLVLCSFHVLAASSYSQDGRAPVARFDFDGNLDNAPGASVAGAADGTRTFVAGLEGQALRLTAADSSAVLTLDRDNRLLDRGEDFSVQYWIRTTMDSAERTVMLSLKEFADNSLASQKQSGWVFYISDGTWAWNMGSGGRRITYERDNGEHMPLNDGRWHQLTMTYDIARSEVRLFYDGQNRVVYNVDDSVGFDFTSGSPSASAGAGGSTSAGAGASGSTSAGAGASASGRASASVGTSGSAGAGALVVGWVGTEASPRAEILPAIHAGAENLQELVDAFNRLGVSEVAPDEFVSLIVEPERFFDQKVDATVETLGAAGAAFRESMQSVDFEAVSAVEAELMDNPYTIHQAFSFMEAAPLLKIYALVDGEVVIDESTARAFTERERLYPPDFDIDSLAIWDRPLSAGEVRDSYAEHFMPVAADLDEAITSITVGSWNIFHGGKHFTVEEHGWDSRVAIAEILERQDVDVLMMQETYSSGDFIAAELGYYFATTVDWDYLNQGANISVLSRYPIEEVYVEQDSPFMTVAAKIAISETQHLYAMSNWYGMDQFPAVFAFNESRFAESDTIPTVFAGDFNAVPHTDGGDSPASPIMLGAGFADAFRSLHPDVAENPGATHRNGRRIDQLYYKGAALRNTSTRLVTTWPTGFPSDHNLILATFDLSSPPAGRR